MPCTILFFAFFQFILHQTLEEVKKIEGLQPYVEQYEQLVDALKKGHASETRLAGRCKQLLDQCKRQTEQIQAAVKTESDDQATITSLENVLYSLYHSLSPFSHTILGKELNPEAPR